MIEGLLLKDNDITENTILGGNIDPDKFRFCIKDAQVSRLEECLGETLYNKIVDDFTGNVLSGYYQILYEKYIYPFLIHQSALEYIKCGAYMVNNAGIFKHTPQNGTPAEKPEVDFIVNNQRDMADMYMLRMEKWLCKNKSNLPEYKCDPENIVNPKRQSYGTWDLPC